MKPFHSCLLAGFVVFSFGGCRTMEEGPVGTGLPAGSSMTLLVPFTVPADRAEPCVAALHAAGYDGAAAIGEIVAEGWSIEA